MVVRMLKEANRVNSPKITRMEQKNSAKVAKIKLVQDPIPRGSGNISYFSEKGFGNLLILQEVWVE